MFGDASPARCTTGPSAWPTAAPRRPTRAARCASRCKVESTASCALRRRRADRPCADLRASPRRAPRPDMTDRDPLDLPLLRRRLRRDHRERRRADHRRARRPGPSGQLRAPVQQGQHAAPHRRGERSRARRGCCSRCGARSAAPRRSRVDWDDGARRCRRRASPRVVARARPRRGRASTSRASCSPRTTTSSTSWPKGLIGTNNIDTNSRLCMSQRGRRLQGHARRRRAAGVLRRHRARRHASSSPAATRPGRTRSCSGASRTPSARNPTLKIIVADPRRTETAEAADLYLPLLPGTDVALFHGMLHLLLWEGLTDPAYIAAHTTRLRCAARPGARVHAEGDGATDRRARRRPGAGRPLVRTARRRHACRSTARG